MDRRRFFLMLAGAPAALAPAAPSGDAVVTVTLSQGLEATVVKQAAQEAARLVIIGARDRTIP